MIDPAAPRYRYLNREGRWLDFEVAGLELRDDGALHLSSLPLATGRPPPGLVGLGEPDGPAGVTAAPGGDVFFTDPSSHRLLVVDGCDGHLRGAPCVAGPGGGPGELLSPRGLAVHPGRGALLVGDSGNGRVQLLALPDLHVAEIRTGWADPRSLACDADGNAYVVDAADGSVHKRDPLGQPVPAFWETIRAQWALAAAEVAVGAAGGTARILILDRAGRVHLVDPDGRPQRRWATGLARPMGLATSGDVVYVGDNASRRLVVFGIDGSLIGAAQGYAGPVAAVAVDGRGGLLLNAGGGLAPQRLSARGAYRSRGLMWGGPFQNPSVASSPRHLIRATVDGLGPGAHLQLFVVAQGAGEAPPPVRPDDTDPFADERWRRLPVAPDAVETLVGGAPLDEVWIGMAFAGEGLASPVLSQIRIDFAHETYLAHLPVLYRREAAPGDVLARWLTLYESMFDRMQRGIDGLPSLFDPAAAPPEWLDWLAGWLAVDLPEGWDVGRRRRAIAEAFARDADRGTAWGLGDALRARAGLEASIEEPIVQTGWWSLAGEGAPDPQAALSTLGATTVLAAGEPQGATVGTSAVLDGSFLSPQDRYATPLFADVAHQFTVRVYRGPGYSEDAVAAATAILERERPAHTHYHLCVVEPRMRVGVQARLSVDAIVAGPPGPTPLDASGDDRLVLAGPVGGRIGQTSELGQTHLGDSAADG